MPDEIREPADADQRALLDQYAVAFENADLTALMRLLRADAVFEMPPVPTWFAGREQIGRFLAAHVLREPGDLRMVPTAANGQPALAAYRRGHDGVYRAHAVQVLTCTGTGIARIVAFMSRGCSRRSGCRRNSPPPRRRALGPPPVPGVLSEGRAGSGLAGGQGRRAVWPWPRRNWVVATDMASSTARYGRATHSPGIPQVAGGAAGQDPDHHVHRHCHEPDRPQHLERGGLAGEHAAVIRGRRRDRAAPGPGELARPPAGAGGGPGRSRQSGTRSPWVTASYARLIRSTYSSTFSRHRPARREPLDDGLALRVRSPHVQTIVHGRAPPRNLLP